MKAGPDNAEMFTSLNECRALGKLFERRFTGITYQIFEVTDDSLRVVGSFPKPINAAGVTVRRATEAERTSRDPLAEESLSDAWRNYFESYSSDIDDEWNKFRESLFVVGGSKLKIVRPEDEDDEDDDDDEDGTVQAGDSES
mmetsp:Transcript_6615/g.17938  ORF Transcript_6615/g.17938 Transcript_6615/m.17938 type:complete len:142 (+) Transcript_6615:1-426(+)